MFPEILFFVSVFAFVSAVLLLIHLSPILQLVIQ